MYDEKRTVCSEVVKARKVIEFNESGGKTAIILCSWIKDSSHRARVVCWPNNMNYKSCLSHFVMVLDAMYGGGGRAEQTKMWANNDFPSSPCEHQSSLILV